MCESVSCQQQTNKKKVLKRGGEGDTKWRRKVGSSDLQINHFSHYFKKMVKKFNLQHYLNHLKNPNKQKLQQQIKEEITDGDLTLIQQQM